MTKYAKKIREIVEISRSHPTAEQIFEEKRINGEGMVIIGLSPKRKY